MLSITPEIIWGMRQGAHDVGNQLTIANGFRELCEQEMRAGQEAFANALNHLGKARAADAKAMEIVREMLSAKRAVGLFDLNAVAREAVEHITGRADRESVTVETSIAGEPLMILGTELHIFRAIVNLCMNSMNAMSGRMVSRLSVSVSRNGPDAEIEIADTGRGLPKEAMAAMWETRPGKPHRLHGHGLCFVKKAVDELHGRIETAGEHGFGLSVCLILPLAVRAGLAESGGGTVSRTGIVAA